MLARPVTWSSDWRIHKNALSDEKATCESELARLGRFSGTIEVLTRVAMPVPETLDTFETAL